MMENLLLTALISFALLGGASIGFVTQRRLRPNHVSREAFDSVRLLMSMLLTFTALVLGLLTSSAKERHDSYNKLLSDYAADLIELDHRLRVYGPDADPIRKSLRAYTAAAIAYTWPAETRPDGDYPDAQNQLSIESTSLGNLLAEIDVRIQKLAPLDVFHSQIAERLRNRVADTIQRRWQLILSSRSTISWPFLVILTAWLVAIFGIFALTAPRNGLVFAVVVLAALSISSPLYLIFNYSGSQSGKALELSSAPMRAALSHMDRDR